MRTLYTEHRLPRKPRPPGELPAVQVTRFAYGEEPFTARWGEMSWRPPAPGTECWMVEGRAGVSAAPLPLEGLARVGHFEAGDREAAVEVLGRAVESLLSAGARKVLGPMDGTTWERYRLALEGPAGQDSFRGEPTNPPHYPTWFEAAGFRAEQLYSSTITRRLEGEGPAAPAGVTIRPLGDFERDLESLHALSLDAFRHNPYYSPISLERFQALYRPLRPLLCPELVLLAEEEGRVVGVALSYPDERPGRLVLKTLATASDRQGRGLGTLLTAGIHRRAREQGFECVIHALMHSQNASQRVSRRTGEAELWRRYALYAREAA